MNWINMGFYYVILLAGVSWILLRISPIRTNTPAWLVSFFEFFAEMLFIVLIIFLFRSWAYEPFRIPSGSMMPTLEAGDFILVNKYEHGLRLPGVDYHFTEGDKLKRGEVIVFRYPPNPTLDYIKRLVGLPGDIIDYKSTTLLEGNRLISKKVLMINGEIISKKVVLASEKEPLVSERKSNHRVFREKLGEKTHLMREYLDFPAMSGRPNLVEGNSYCEYRLPDLVRCKVPEDHYFMMGDNRDDSLDSRYWGFVPKNNVVGRATYVWLNMPAMPDSFGEVWDWFKSWKTERIGSIE